MSSSEMEIGAQCFALGCSIFGNQAASMPMATGFKSLTVGERVEVTYHRAKQESYRYVAERVRRIPQR